MEWLKKTDPLSIFKSLTRFPLRSHCIFFEKSSQFGMAFDRKELVTFLSVVRLGSIGNAAAALSITQPAISRILHRLEDRLGAKLFVRHSTGMELNAFGRALLPHAELLESEARRVQEEIDLLKGSATGLVRVGVVPSIAARLLPQAISNALLKSPKLHIHIVESTGNQLLASLNRREIDFAIVGLWREPMDENIVAIRLFRDEVCVIGRWNHPAMEKKPLSLSDLQAYPWVLPEKGNVLWSEFHLTFQRAGLEPPTAAVTANSVHAMKALVATSDFMTILARESFQLEQQSGLIRAVPIEAARWSRQLALLCRSKGKLLPVANLLAREIRKIADQFELSSSSVQPSLLTHTDTTTPEA